MCFEVALDRNADGRLDLQECSHFLNFCLGFTNRHISTEGAYVMSMWLEPRAEREG